MAKKKTPKEVIESEEHPEIEHVYTKVPREELENVTKWSSPASAEEDIYKVLYLAFKRKDKGYVSVHTHPTNTNRYVTNKNSAIPSVDDLSAFNRFANRQTMVIAQTNKKTGKLQGYTLIMKKKVGRGDWGGLKSDDIEKYGKKVDYNSLKKMMDNYEWGLKFVPAKEYHFNKDWGVFEMNYSKEKNHNLEDVVSSIIIGFGFSFLLARVSITGNVILNQLQGSRISLFLIRALLLSGIVYFILKLYKK